MIPLLMVIGGWILLVAGGGLNFSVGNLPN
jgi:hypothetical protein